MGMIGKGIHLDTGEIGDEIEQVGHPVEKTE